MSGLAEYLHLQGDVQRLNRSFIRMRADCDLMVQTVKRLEFVNQDVFITPEKLTDKLKEMEMYF